MIQFDERIFQMGQQGWWGGGWSRAKWRTFSNGWLNHQLGQRILHPRGKISIRHPFVHHGGCEASTSAAQNCDLGIRSWGWRGRFFPPFLWVSFWREVREHIQNSCGMWECVCMISEYRLYCNHQKSFQDLMVFQRDPIYRASLLWSNFSAVFDPFSGTKGTMKTTHNTSSLKNTTRKTPHGREVFKFFLQYTTNWCFYLSASWMWPFFAWIPDQVAICYSNRKVSKKLPEWVYIKDLELRSFKAAIDAWSTQESQSPRLIHATATNTSLLVPPVAIPWNGMHF